ncbi:MAG: hypothetical protein IPN29_08785 [Saprospiraceae bacterium]|nr:hypothetical protein [Saprospiraceae bacterium]
MRLLLMFFLFMVLVRTGLAQETISSSIDVNGVKRTFRLYIPKGYAQKSSLPLVFNFHGTGSNGSQQQLYSQQDLVADTAVFLVCYPDANGFAFDLAGTGDVVFTSKLIDLLVAQYKADACRVYATGLSNGGFFSQKLACEIPEKIAAIASVAGTLTLAQLADCNEGPARPVLHIHGTADNIVNFNGAATGFLSYVGVYAMMSYLHERNQCSGDSTITRLPDKDINDGATVDLISYGGCEAPTQLLRVNGGGHTWPGAVINIGVTTKDISASEESWLFFKTKSLPGCISSLVDSNIKRSLDIGYVLDGVVIETPETVSGQLLIYDITGKLLVHQKVVGNRFGLSWAQLGKGLMLVELLGADGIRRSARFVSW